MASDPKAFDADADAGGGLPVEGHMSSFDATPRRLTFEGASVSSDVGEIAKKRARGSPPSVRIAVEAYGSNAWAPWVSGAGPRASPLRARVTVNGTERGFVRATLLKRSLMRGDNFHRVCHGAALAGPPEARCPALPLIARLLFRSSAAARDAALADSPAVESGGPLLHVRSVDLGRYGRDAAAEAVSQLARRTGAGVTTYLVRTGESDDDDDDDDGGGGVVTTAGDDAAPFAAVGFRRVDAETAHDLLYCTAEMLAADAARLPPARALARARADLLRADALADAAASREPVGADRALRDVLFDAAARSAFGAACERGPGGPRPAAAGVRDRVAALVAAGANVDAAGLLHVAVRRAPALVPALIDDFGADVDFLNGDGVTPLMAAAERLGWATASLDETAAVVAALLSRGADAGLVDAAFGLSALGFFRARTVAVDDDAAIRGVPRPGLRADLAAALAPPGGPTPNDEAVARRASGLALADVLPRLGEIGRVRAAAAGGERCDACRAPLGAGAPAFAPAAGDGGSLCLACVAARLGGHIEPDATF